MEQNPKPDYWLAPLGESTDESRPDFLEMTRQEYFELVDWTGRQVRENAAGFIPEHLDSIMVRLQIQSGAWLDAVQGYNGLFFRVAGKETAHVPNISITPPLCAVGASRAK